MKTIIVSLMFALLASGAAAQAPDWQKTWDATLAGAKRDGKVVIAGSPDPVMRNEIIPKFTARFGIAVDFIAGRSGQTVERVKVERAAGIHSVDIYMSGPDTTFNVLYAEKLIDPLKPMLITPAVTNPSNWKGGKPWFMDSEEQYVMRLFNSLNNLLFINTDYVKPEEMRRTEDLLNPKWRGRIATDDPTTDSGSGGARAALFYAQLGPQFVKSLYIDQRAVINRDRRQTTDWLARGTYPLCLTCRADDVRPLQKEGFKILEIFELAGILNGVNSTPFLLTVANKAPHPDAARVFVNWLADKEAMEIYSRGYEAATLRTDVDESFLDPRSIPRPGVNYFDDADPKWRSAEKLEIGNKLRAMFKQQ